MLTIKDIARLSGIFVTKQDLEKFATKEDLNSFATRQQLQTEIKILRIEMASKQDLKALEERFDDKFNLVLDRLDNIALELKDFRQEQTFHTQEHRDIREKLAACIIP